MKPFVAASSASCWTSWHTPMLNTLSEASVAEVSVVAAELSAASAGAAVAAGAAEEPQAARERHIAITRTIVVTTAARERLFFISVSSIKFPKELFQTGGSGRLEHIRPIRAQNKKPYGLVVHTASFQHSLYARNEIQSTA